MYAKILLMTAVLLSGQVYAQSAPPTTPVVKAKTKKKKKVAPVTNASTEVAATPIIAPAEEVKKVEVKSVIEPAKPFDLAKAIAPLTVGELHTFQYIKEHISASYHGEYYAVRRDATSPNHNDRSIQDIKIMHNPTVTFKPSNNWLYLATGEFKYSDMPSVAYPNNFYRALFTATRKNLFTEKENGLQVDAGIGRRVFNAGVATPSYGNNRVFTTLTKTFGKSNASLFLQYLHNDYKNSSATTWKHGLEVIPTVSLQLTEKLSYLFNDDIVFNLPKYQNTARDFSTSHEMNLAYISYQWTDKISTYYQFKYYHTDDFTKAPQTQDDWFEHYVGVGYAFNPKATVTFEVGSEIFHARDNEKLFSMKSRYPELALYLDLSL
ncbi:MAG: hypothetical protein PHY93_01320 [Bacteriovorax sp.]|nr:hypothetical protein [Bacteriovorax sp.]